MMEDTAGTNHNTPFDTTIDGVPFSVLLSQAVKIKTAQKATLRTTFDKYPTFYQNSMFPSPEVEYARAQDFEKRIQEALKMKDKGNEAFQLGKFHEAMTLYEQSISVFKYLENLNPHLKTEGIMDDYIKEIYFKGEKEEEEVQVKDLLVSNYNNISIVAIKTESIKTAISACNETLLIDERNVKALYLRSKARLIPKSAGATEEDLAMMDLRKCLKVDPSLKDARALLMSVKKGRNAYKKRGKRSFSRIFEETPEAQANNTMDQSQSKLKSMIIRISNYLSSKRYVVGKYRIITTILFLFIALSKYSNWS